jgi:MoxR-like ATPase
MASTRLAAFSQIGYTFPHVERLAHTALLAGKTVFLTGHPGVGKSDLAQGLAHELGLEDAFHDIRLSHREPADICGVYYPQNGELTLMAPAWVRAVCKAPGFVFLDELNSCSSKMMQSVSYQICLEHRIGEHRFHPDTVVMAAGNLPEDNAIVVELSSALNNRMVHLCIKPCVKTWLKDFAKKDNNIHPDIIRYFEAFPKTDLLYCQTGTDAFPSPRSWAMASDLYAIAEPRDRRRLLAACIGPKASEGFISFLKLSDRINAQQIIVDAEAIRFDTHENSEPSFVHAAVDSVTQWCKIQHKWERAWNKGLIKFLKAPGLDPEYQFLFLRSLKKARSKPLETLKSNASYRKLCGELVQLHTGVYQ